MYIFDLGKLEKDWNCRSIMAQLPLTSRKLSVIFPTYTPTHSKSLKLLLVFN